MDEMKRTMAMEEDCFLRDEEEDVVYCPQGFVLYRKSTKKDGRARYISKHSCRVCTKHCFPDTNSQPWKEIDFRPGVTRKDRGGRS